MIVLDTNVLSELMKERPAEAVARWADRQPRGVLYVTSITQAEVLQGLELLTKGKRRDALGAKARFMFERVFAGRVLRFGAEAATCYASLAAARRRAGRPISIFDAQIAAIALANQASIATRNVDDFAGCGVTIFDPWREH